MPILLYHGPPATDRSIRSRMERKAFESFLVIVPTRRRMRHLQRSPLGPGGSAAHALMIHTLETLALRMLPRIRPELVLADGILPSLLYQEAARRAGADFRYFSLREGPFPLPQGTFATMVSVLTRLRETGVTPGALESELPSAEPDEVHKLADVAGIARAYELLLASRSATDVPGAFQILAGGCSQGRFADVFREFFPHVDLVVAAGFDEFTGPEIGLLTRLRSLEHTGLLLAFDVVPGNTALFGHLEENLEHFRNLGLRPVDVPQDRLRPAFVDTHGRRSGDADAALGRVVRRIFAPGDGRPRDNLREGVTLVRAQTRRDEVEAVCRLVKSLLQRSPDREPGRICVAMITPSVYTVLLRHAFARYGIPVNITDRSPLSHAPVVIGIMGLLRIAARDFLRDDVLRVLSRPEFRGGREGPSLDPSDLAGVSGRLKITGGYASWLRRIEQRRARLGESGADAAERAALDRARECLERLHALLDPVSGPLLPSEFPLRLRDLLRGIGLLERLLAGAPQDDPLAPERETRATARFLDVVDDVCAYLASDPDAGGAHPLRYYLDQLTVALSAERYTVREEFGRGVLVTAIEETRGLPIDTMILIGLVDGEFPSMYRAEVFYSLERQHRRARRHIWEQRYLFYQAITNWSDHLYLLHPCQEGDCELVRSAFLDDLLGVADIRTMDAREIIPPDILLSRHEALRAVVTGRAAPEALPAAAAGEAAVLCRAAGAEAGRRRGTASAFSGILGDALSPSALADLDRVAGRVYSVTQLETYAGCPFRFFTERVLGVRAEEDLAEGLSALERGNLVHEILYTASVRMRGEGIAALWRATDREVARAEEILLAAAAEKLDVLDPPDPFWHLDREVLIGGEGRQGLLHRYLAAERARTTALTPEYFEVAFGAGAAASGAADPELSREEPVTVGGVRLRGRVDRVETGEDLFAIVDYKTGRSEDSLESVREGRSLQLPLYLLVVAGLLERRLGRRLRPAAGFHYLLGKDAALRLVMANNACRGAAFEAGSKSHQIVPDDAAFEALLDGAAAHAGAIAAGVRSGRFPLAAPARREKLCTVCPCVIACRVRVQHPAAVEEEDDS